MPIMAIYRHREVDPETFNRYRALLPIKPLPEGAIFHLVAFDDDGLLGIDVWESEAQLRAYEDTRIKPAVEQLGKAWVEPTVLQIHELWAADAAPEHNRLAPPPQPTSMPA